MAVKKTKKEIPDTSTQRYLPFSQIKENIVIMKDDSARMVLKCSTINFLLKSTEEQDAIIMSFQRFLYSLAFPIQILVRSSNLVIDAYISRLNDRAIEQKNTLLQNQTYEYIEYLKKLIEVAQIMRKDFYIIVPFDQDENNSVKDSSMFAPFKSFWSSLFNNSIDVIKIKSQIRNFSKMKKGLTERVSTVKTSLENVGIKSETMEKTELIKFLTDYYNPNLDGFAQMNNQPGDYNLMKDA